MNVLYEAIASLHRQVDERIADDATTPCLLSFDRARAVLDALLAYTTPQRREWVGLTDEEIIEHFQTNVDTGSLLSFADGVRYAEAKLREKNNG